MDMNYARHAEYLAQLTRPHIAATRIEWLNDDGTVAFDITEEAIQEGTISVQFQNGTRRTADVTLKNWDQTFDVNANRVWFGQQVRLSRGLYLADGTAYTIPQGVFYVSNPDQVYRPSTRTTHLSLVDKWSYLDGTLFGNLDGVYQLNVGDDLFVALRELLLKDRGNGVPLDLTPPLLSGYYKDKTDIVTYTKAIYNIDSSGNEYTTTEIVQRNVPVIQCPYTMRIEASGTIADIVNEIGKMLVANIGYDATGRLCVEPNNTDIKNSSRPVLWNYRTQENTFLGVSYQFPLTDVFNSITVTGATLNGLQAKGTAQNVDARSGTSINRIGAKCYYEEQNSYHSNAQCQEMSEYLLHMKSSLLTTTTIDSLPLYHLRENCLVTIERPEASSAVETYLVTGYSMPVGQLGTMSVNSVRVSDSALS